MAQLEIKGHETRGSEVIALLEMLGGINSHNLYGDESYAYYTIDSDKEIKGGIYMFVDEDVLSFSLEQFEEQFPYKFGDKVTHNMGILMNVVHMYWDAECNVIRYDIQSPVDNNYKFKAMLAEHLQPYKEENMKEKLEQITLDIPKGYEFFGINDDNQVVLAKKQLQYPKTYDECCKVISVPIRNSIGGHKWKILQEFQKLIVCRDAYWKIAGDWKPDWKNYDVRKYCIATDKNIVGKYNRTTGNKVLAFPTEEMRDAFYENFKDLIEICKELL